jgi:uncharacterized protein YaaN involved in tellurite resistance
MAETQTTTSSSLSIMPAIMPQAEAQIANALIRLDAAASHGVAAQLDPDRRETILEYGNEVYNAASKFADEVLAKTSVDQLGALAEPLGQFRRLINGLDPSRLRQQGFFKRIFGNASKELQDFIRSFKAVKDQVDGIVVRLQDKKSETMIQIRVLDQLYGQVEALVHDLTPVIAAAKATKAEWEGPMLTSRLAEADNAAVEDKQSKAQRVQDLRGSIEVLGQKIDGLEKSRFILVTQGPAIRQIQSGSEQAANQIVMTIGQAIPVWKIMMVQAAGQADMLAAAGMVQAQRNATEDLIMKQAEMLGQGVQLQKENAAKGIADVGKILAAMEKVQAALTAADNAAAEASAARAKASADMAGSEAAFRQYLARREPVAALANPATKA